MNKLEFKKLYGLVRKFNKNGVIIITPKKFKRKNYIKHQKIRLVESILFNRDNELQYPHNYRGLLIHYCNVNLSYID